ncbi:hypothetical protein ACFQV2_14090 [Actinokineospora soli]|uniref:von Willebrand factor type A domain-containing protein n=1 Tax=Actinokineospora soli TaxID=1048753 RepID=A0ABW2TLE6_9PSEU
MDVLPCYLVCDVSFSMVDHIDELNAGLREFRGAVHADPAVGARLRVCVVGFADEPRLLQPLRPAAQLTELGGPAPAGTNFGPAFAFLREVVDRDVRGLKAQRLRVRRPVVFFTSDGRPTDRTTWQAAFAAFADPDWAARPHVVAFGLGAADHVTLGRIGTSRVFLGRDGVRVGLALMVSLASTGPDHV